MRNAFIQQLMQLAACDPRVTLMTADLGFGVLDEFAQRFPRQYLNVGVAEQNMMGLATGLALEGRIIFTYSIANFPTLRCLEQLRNDACYHGVNINVVAIGGGFSYGALGFSHHATEDLSILRALAHITITAPGDLWEAAEATRALAGTPGVGYLRLDKSAAHPTHQPGERFQLGKARMLRDGSDCTLISTGGILGAVVGAADQLKASGVFCRIISMHTVKPLDEETVVRAAQETGGIITVEEHTIDGGLGGAVAETCLDRGGIPTLFYRAGLRNEMATMAGDQEFLRKQYGLDAAALARTVRQCLAQRKLPTASTVALR